MRDGQGFFADADHDRMAWWQAGEMVMSMMVKESELWLQDHFNSVREKLITDKICVQWYES